MRVTRVSQYINAPREILYRALIDPSAIAIWKVPTGMTCRVHTFDARVGGTFRISLTYDTPTGVGKTTAHTDTYRGRFVELVPKRVASPLLKGETVQVRRLALEEVCWPNLPLTQIEEVVLIPAHMVCPNS